MRTMDMTAGALSAMIYDLLRGHLLCVNSDFTEDSDLQSAGLDSLALTQLLLELQRKTGHWLDESRIDEETLKSCRTLGACMSAFISERANASDV